MAVNIRGTFKKDQRGFNGLEGIAGELMSDPFAKHVIVAVVEPARIIDDIIDGGTRSVTVRLVHIEPLDGEAADAARTLLQNAYSVRTGGGQLQASLFDPDPADATGGGADPDDDPDGEDDPDESDDEAPPAAFSHAER